MFSHAVGRGERSVTGERGQRSQGLGHTGLAPAHSVSAFPVYTAQAPGCSAAELSKAGPGLRVLPRSKPFRFRFLGIPQRHRLGWECVLCPSQVRAAQVTRCLVSSVTPSWRLRVITSPVPTACFSGYKTGTPFQVCRMSLLGS